MAVGGSSKDDSAQEEESQKTKKSVTWSPDVKDNHVKYGNLLYPVMINSSELVNGKMVYEITIRLRDCTWTVHRRYSEFETFHEALLVESVLGMEEYPPLPKKRWFEITRWTSRHDEEYTKERRGELQKYLQILFKTNKKILIQKSKVLQTFLEFHHMLDTMRHRREMLIQSSSSIDGDVTPPSDTDMGESEGSSTDTKDDYIDKKEIIQDKQDSHRSVIDMFSMSTGWGADDSENITSLPQSENETPPVPLKSCLKKTSSIRAEGINQTDVMAPPSKATPTQEEKEKSNAKKRSSSVSQIDPLEELKDFVRILIL